MAYILDPTFRESSVGFVVNGLGSILADWFGYDLARASVTMIFFSGVYVIIAQDYCLFYRYCVINTNSRFYELLVSWKGVAGFHTFALSLNLGLSVSFYICTATIEVI
uniref:Uncharacterized protein n=1 Tax=Panagrolaimus sp. JU765 TaxID=591449 RepID=A0AC34RNA5_9BILA